MMKTIRLKYWSMLLLSILFMGACSNGELEGDLYPVSPDKGGNGRNNSETIKSLMESMVRISGGTFLMGSERSEARDNESPAHPVKLDAFYISRYEVTQRLWTEIMGNNPSAVKSPYAYSYTSDYPVTNVSYNDCLEFIRKLNEKTGKEFALPTEAQWELAARGVYNFSDYGDKCASSFISNSELYHVSSSSPNLFGLYCMSGNVKEWVADWYGDYSSEEQENPAGPSTGQYRIFRGGSYVSIEDECRVTARAANSPSTKGDDLGFRLVMNGIMDLQVNPLELSFPRSGGQKTITVTTGKNWTYQSSVTWCHLNKSGNELTVDVESHNGKIRTAKITITAGADDIVIIVSQEGDSFQKGDMYDKNGVKGIIYEMSSDGRSGKIVSLRETSRRWGTIYHIINAISMTDGEANMQMFPKEYDYSYYDFEAFVWCYDYSNDHKWYLPALNELKDMFTAIQSFGISKFDQILSANGGDEFSSASDYWSSTEYSGDNAYAYTVNRSGRTNYTSKVNDYRVRAIRKVTFD